MDKLGAMAILVKIVEAGSLSAAAKQLDVPLATVSRRIAETRGSSENAHAEPGPAATSA
ncbi:MAG: LysR family transcriptional regulator [Acetobacteraceae bacterium]